MMKKARLGLSIVKRSDMARIMLRPPDFMKCRHAVCIQQHRSFIAGCKSHQVNAQIKNTDGAQDQDKFDIKRFMKAWQIHDFQGVSGLQCSDDVSVPFIDHPNDVLIKVLASSVNPLDIAMTEGYGHNMLQAMRELNRSELPNPFNIHPEFPLTLGRDFAGKVVNKGQDVKDLDIGDEVFGVVGPHKQGAHAEYTVTSAWEVVRKPQKLDFTQSAAVPFAALTAWSALCITGHISSRNASKMRILILGGSGGVGTFAVQLLRRWGAEVVTTCGPESVELMLSLGANTALDYTDFATDGELLSMKKFDVIIDAAGANNPKYLDLLKPWNYSKYVTLSPPVLGNTDKFGIVGGMIQNVVDLTSMNVMSHMKGSSYRWAFYTPNRWALNEIRRMLDDGKIRPIIETVYQYVDMPDAFEKVKSGTTQGKVVIDFAS